MDKVGSLRLKSAGIDYAGRIEVSSGVVKAISTKLDPFLSGAYVAQAPWKNLSKNAIETMTTNNSFVHGQDFALLSISSDIKSLILSSDLFSGHSVEDLEMVYRHPEYLEVTNNLLSLISNQYSFAHSEHNQFLTMSLAYPDQTSTAIGNYRTSKGENIAVFLGLHLDTTFDLPIVKLHESRNRISINIGRSHRFIQIIPFSALEIAKALNEKSIPVNMEKPISDRIDRRFLELYPETPVYRIRVNPFEAYIAATDNYIHDGSTPSTTDVDVALHFLGQFTPN